jgi:hypothetical protein
VGGFERALHRQNRWMAKFGAWLFVATPLLWIAFGDDYEPWEPAILPVIGVAMLLWMRVRGPLVPEHLARVEYVDFEEAPPYYQAACDCGWEGERQRYEEAARHDAGGHTPHVRGAIEDFSED